MSFWVSLAIAIILIGLILLFAAREISFYRKDRSMRSEIYPYTETRLIRRLVITACLIAEVVLLVLVRFTLTPVKPFWFLVYVGAVLALVVAMVVLSLLDLRESLQLRAWSLDRLNREFFQEIRQGATPPETD